MESIAPQKHGRGLASAPEEIRFRVARAGGLALHEKRGLQASPEDVRKRIARLGGLARGKQRREERVTARAAARREPARSKVL